MSNRQDVTAILADIDDTMLRVRDLSTSSERSAALQCLSDARVHLYNAKLSHDRSECDTEPMLRAAFPSDAPPQGPPVIQATRAELLEIYPPPSATSNQRVRSEADQAFRKSREILRGVLK